MLQMNTPDFGMFVLFFFSCRKIKWMRIQDENDGILFCRSTSLVCFLNVNVVSLAGFAHRCVALT